MCEMKLITKTILILNLAVLCVACNGDANVDASQGVDMEARLSSLSLSVGTLDPEFNLTTINYSATVPNDTESVTVSATTSDVNDSFTINGRNIDTVALAEGDNTISVEVESEDGLTGRVYTIVVTRLSVAQQAYSDLSMDDAINLFGLTIKLSGDGATLAVGDVDDNSVSVLMRGSAGVWQHQAYVTPNLADADDLFGLSVALSNDGNTLAVGAVDEDSSATGVNGNQMDNSAPRAGAVYVFSRDDARVWTQQAYLKASNTDANDLFGLSTALSDDGNTLAVGAVDEDSAANSVNGDQANNSSRSAGAVYVFARDSGNTWTQQAYVKGSNTGADAAFGWQVFLSSDGNRLAVYSFDENSLAAGDQAIQPVDSVGSAYVFSRDSSGVWMEQSYVYALTGE